MRGKIICLLPKHFSALAALASNYESQVVNVLTPKMHASKRDLYRILELAN